MAPTAALPAWIPGALTAWSSRWGIEDLAQLATVRVSRRMTRSFGRADVTTATVTVAARLLDGDPDVLRETVCHEAAHLATRMLHPRRRVAPHGPEWSALMIAAGYPPAATAPADPAAAPFRPRPRLVVHRCPVCGAERIAARTVPQWRCVRCVRAGLDGRLEVARLPAGPGRADGDRAAVGRWRQWVTRSAYERNSRTG